MDKIVGLPRDNLPKCFLPTRKMILQRWRSMTRGESETTPGQSNRYLAECLTYELLKVWELSRLITIRKDKVKEKIIKLITEVNTQIKRQEKTGKVNEYYTESLKHCLNIGVQNMEDALRSNHRSHPKWEEDLKFYNLQLKVPQEGSMFGIDKLTAELEERIEERRLEVELRMAAEQARQEEERYIISRYLRGRSKIS